MTSSTAAQTDYRSNLEKMSDAALKEECETYIWLSAYAANNEKSIFHVKCDLTYAECKRRGKAEIYTKAHDTMKSRVGK